MSVIVIFRPIYAEIGTTSSHDIECTNWTKVGRFTIFWDDDSPVCEIHSDCIEAILPSGFSHQKYLTGNG